MSSTIEMAMPEFDDWEKRWRRIAEVFGLSISVVEASSLGFSAELGSIVVLECTGENKGMVVLQEGSDVPSSPDDILDRSYGFSVVEPGEFASLEDIEDTREMLIEWGCLP